SRGAGMTTDIATRRIAPCTFRRTVLVVFLLAVTLVGVSNADPVEVGPETYRGWPNTYRLANGLVEVRVLTDIGPRIIDVRAAGGTNLFHVRDAEAGGHGEAKWIFRGGWRLWVAPERDDTTYVLDNSPCTLEKVDPATVRVTGPSQPAAGIRKQID